MDDSRFDDIIKKKVSEFQPEGFDPSALASFHYRMDGVNTSQWYSRYRTELVHATAIAASTILILLTLWFSDRRKLAAIENSEALIQLQRTEISELKRQVEQLKTTSADTVYVREESVVSPLLLHKIAHLEEVIGQMSARFEVREAITASSNPLLPETVTSFSFDDHPIQANSIFSRHQVRSNMHNVVSKTTGNRRVSIQTLRELERHYMTGIGIRVGPAVELSTGFYQAGSGQLDYSGGLLADFILSPAFSLETGAKFLHRFYEIGESELSSLSADLPNINKDLGPMVTADVDSWMLEIPLNIKFRTPLSVKTHWLAGLGYSSLIFTKQVFEYEYRLSANESILVNESHRSLKSSAYPGTLNISLGIAHRLKSNKVLETTLYYQRGLGKTGMEQTEANFVGLRSSYWFTLR